MVNNVNRKSSRNPGSRNKEMTTPVGGTGSGAHDEVLAGEYVLGALHPDMERVVAARLKTDRQFAAMVRRWQDNLSDMDDGEADPWLIAASARVSTQPVAVDFSMPRRSLWQSFGLWRGVGVALIGILAIYTIFAAQNPVRTSAQTPPVIVTAIYDPVKASISVDASTPTASLTKIWIIDIDRQAHLVGELPAHGFIALDDEMKRLMDNGGTLAVAPGN